jgi:hypothetical protein
LLLLMVLVQLLLGCTQTSPYHPVAAKAHHDYQTHTSLVLLLLPLLPLLLLLLLLLLE